MTEKQRRWYEDTLSAYINGNGQRWNGNLSGKLTTAAIACKLSVNDVVSDVAARMPNFTAEHAAKIRTDMETAARHQGERLAPGDRSRYQREPEPSGCANYVRELIAAGGSTASSADIFALSPVPVKSIEKDPRAASTIFMRTLWNPGDLLHIFAHESPRRAELGADLRTRDEWLAVLEAQNGTPGDCIGKNPYSGQCGMNGEGKPSYTAKECVSAYRFALIEFDHLPLREQCAFWIGFISRPNLAQKLAALTYSGGKSIHGLIRTGADPITAPSIERKLRMLFCADQEKRTRNREDGTIEEYYPYRADPATLRPQGGTRLAGAHRFSNGRIQTLIYLAGQTQTPSAAPFPFVRPAPAIQQTQNVHQTETASPSNAVTDTAAKSKADAPATGAELPKTGATKFTYQCAVCLTRDKCQAAFGKFWSERSNGGAGCHHAFGAARQT